MSRLIPWDKIKDHYHDILVLGNGASVAVDGVFGYGSLKERAESKDRITSDLTAIFKYLDTTDFELVLEMLWHTSNIIKALNMPDTRPSLAYDQIKSALIETVREAHVPYEKIQAYLPPMFSFMGRFKSIVSLNYDLLVYWAMMKGKETRQYEFKDCFNPDEFLYDTWRQLKEPITGCKYSTLVFYPHGNLFLATDRNNSDKKIITHACNNLLETVLRKWDDDEVAPLFVSEGLSQQKIKAIRRSRYLSTIYDSVLPKLEGTVLIYGWSMSENDQHLIEKLIKLETEDVAISIHVGNKTEREVEETCEKYERRIQNCNPIANVTFFNAEDPGCWVHKPLQN